MRHEAANMVELDRTIDAHPDLPPEAILKEDLLRQGLGFDEAALGAVEGKKRRSYFIFSFDRLPIERLERGENLRAPEEICLSGGPRGLRRTIVSVRLDPRSPYRIVLDGAGEAALTLDGVTIAGVLFEEEPPYYRRRLSSGKPLSEVAPTIEWGYLIYLTVFRMCQYFGGGEECRFCDMNGNFRQQVEAGRPYSTVKEAEEILEALSIIDGEDGGRKSAAYTLTGGAVPRGMKGDDEATFYARFAEAIEGRFPGRWIPKMAIQALPREDLGRLRAAGIRIYHPNLEVWDPALFEELCPGKARHVGRDEWIRRILDAAEVFGPSRVIPNMVAGVEMAPPRGFREVADALRSTGEGLEFFMSRGIVPRFTTWCVEPLSALGREGARPAPLAYSAGLLRLWRDTHARHRLPVPPGYGPPGPGRAVFTVNAFMDVIDPGTPVASLES